MTARRYVTPWYVPIFDRRTESELPIVLCVNCRIMVNRDSDTGTTCAEHCPACLSTGLIVPADGGLDLICHEEQTP